VERDSGCELRNCLAGISGVDFGKKGIARSGF